MSEQKPKIKGVLLDIENDEAKVVEFEPTLENYYKMLHCDLIDIVSRTIGYNRSHKVFDIVCDDEGLFKEDAKISAIDNLGNPQLVGSLLIVGLADSKGNETSLTEKECDFVMERIQKMSTRNHPEGYKMLTQCEN